MTNVLLVAAAIWGIGAYLRAPVGQRWTLIGLLYGAVVLTHLVLPDGSGIRMATGERVEPWLALGAVAAVVLAYRAGLARLRARAAPTAGPAPKGGFSDTELDRYARHIMLREIGGPGQARLRAARVLVVGAGGLGSPVLLYLAASGVGTIGVIDDDVVEGSNLQRQIVHSDDRIGMPKVASAMAAMTALNPFVTVRPYRRRLTAEIADALVADYDLVIEGTDSFATRSLVNAACVRAGVPLIVGAITQWEGQVSLFDPARGTPCYACVFPEAPAPGLVPTCAEAGVAAPLPGIVGSVMAMEAVKHLTGAGTPLAGRMLMLDALEGEWRTLTLKRAPDCPVCAARAAAPAA
jgi:molybdopterin/thiamine biosynthesis adenylyltransferase